MIYVFAYHSISNSSYIYATPPDEFERQLLLLKKYCTVIRLGEVEELFKTGLTSRKPYAVVTFDDGIKDNFTTAFPILKKLDVPATIFVSTALMNKKWEMPAGYTFGMLSWNELKEMKESGIVDVQSHATTHKALSTLSETELIQELEIADSSIKNELGSVPKYFSYPKGDFNEYVIKEINKRYLLGFGTDGVILANRNLNKSLLPRIIISKNIGLQKFKFMLNPLYWKLKNVRDTLL